MATTHTTRHRNLGLIARVLVTLVIAVFLMSRPASAVGSDAVQVFNSAVVLLPSATCSGDAASIARLPASCFEPVAALRPSGTTWYFHPATHWYRFAFPDFEGPSTRWLLNVSTYATDGELDVIAPDGRLLQRQNFGSEIPVADRPIYAHELIEPLVTPHPANAVILLRMTTPFERPTVLEMRTAESFAAYNHDTMRDEALPLAFLNGIAVAMGLFNLMLFGMLRRRLYLLYAAAILALVLYQVIETGAAWTMLWPHVGLRDDWPPYAAWVLYFALIVAFTRDFLELPRVAPVADKILLGVLGVLTLESALYLLAPDILVKIGIFDITDPAMTAIMLGTMLACGVIAWRAGISAAPYYVLAFAGSTIGFVISDAGTYDLFPSTVTTAYICTSLGAAWESIFLALALGQRVREIEISAARYEKYAYLDPLTEIPNRRGFDEAIEREWRRTQRIPGPISVIIFDIDHFKDYNDRFGHPAGDQRLMSVARTIAEAARRTGDLAARYGGEEFAMLLPGTPLEGAVAIADAVRLSIREAADVEYRLTISAGCATAYPFSDSLESSSPATLLKDADAALYIAKTTGRDRVCIPETEVLH
jgi:two-component system, sensor histidine kinase LadS